MPLPRNIAELRLQLAGTHLTLALQKLNLSASYQLFKQSANFYHPIFNPGLIEHNELLTTFKRIPIELSACESAIFQIDQCETYLTQKEPDMACSSLPLTHQSELEDLLRISQKIITTMDKDLASIHYIIQLCQSTVSPIGLKSLSELLRIEESWDDEFEFSEKNLSPNLQTKMSTEEGKDKHIALKIHVRTPDSGSDLDWPSDDDSFCEEDLDLIEHPSTPIVTQFNQMTLTDAPKPTADSIKTMEALKYSYS